MKKKILLLIAIIFCIAVFHRDLYAFKHGYQRQTEEIYALVRNDLPVYYDNDGELIDNIPAYTGIKVVESTESWRIIEYRINGEDKSGWITKDDFNWNCLIYDGREKQILADGIYQFSYRPRTAFSMSLSDSAWLPALSMSLFDSAWLPADFNEASFPISLSFAGDGTYYIFRTDTGEYLLPDPLFSKKNTLDRWGDWRHAGLFTLTRQDDYFGIQDASTNRFVGVTEDGLLEFNHDTDMRWRVIRTGGKVLESNDMRVFAQFDPEWAKDYYGRGENEDPESNNFCTSGCGIFSTLNAIYTLTGNYVDPHILADYAVKKDFRIEDKGTDSEFFHAFAEKYGYRYGFSYDGASGSVDEIKKKLKKGDVVIAHVPGHYITIADYKSKSDKYLMLDSHYLPRRGTSPYGDWVDASELEGNALYGYMFYFYKGIGE